jgi:thioredoxin reductase
MASRLSKKHVIYTNGSPRDQVDQIKADKVVAALLQSGIVTLDERKIKRIVMRGIASDDAEPNDHANLILEFTDGPTAHLAFLAHPTHQTLSPGSTMIVKDLGLELTPSGNEIKAISPMQDTSVRGVYVAGDVTTMMKAASFAISLGSAARAMVARELAVEDALFPSLGNT